MLKRLIMERSLGIIFLVFWILSFVVLHLLLAIILGSRIDQLEIFEASLPLSLISGLLVTYVINFARHVEHFWKEAELAWEKIEAAKTRDDLACIESRDICHLKMIATTSVHHAEINSLLHAILLRKKHF